MELVDVAPLNGADRAERPAPRRRRRGGIEHPVARAVAAAARREVGDAARRSRASGTCPGVGVAASSRATRSRSGVATAPSSWSLGRRSRARRSYVRDRVKPTSAAGDRRAEGARADARAADRRHRGAPRAASPPRSASSASSPTFFPDGKVAEVERLQDAGRGRGDGRRRRQRRAGARAGRPRARDRHRHRRRDRGVRPDARLGRPARRRRRDPPRAPDAGDDQGEPLLGVRLQRRRDPARGRRAC